MVKEGHDSTVRPKVRTYGFDGGKLFLDVWAADGKPVLSKNFQGWMRVLGVLTMTGMGFSLVLSDWGSVSQNQEHVFSAVQHAIFGWWAKFIEMDEFDVAKARSVARRSGGEAWSPFASERARENFARAAGRKDDSSS